MVRYMKCPRCELNYIDAEKQEYCDVCLKEMKGIASDLDDMIEEADEELPTELCPICGENMMRAGEKMCEECRKKTEYEEEPDPEEDDEWREYLDDDADADLDEEIGEIDETFDEEFEEEEPEEETYEGDDEEDLEYVTGDEIYSLAGDDDDDDDDKDDKNDDEDF